MANLNGFASLSKASGYDDVTAKEVLGGKSELTFVGAGPVVVNAYDRETKSFTDEVTAYRLTVGMPGVEPFVVKLAATDVTLADLDVLEWGDRVNFDGLEACIIQRDHAVYFRAKGVSRVKKGGLIL